MQNKQHHQNRNLHLYYQPIYNDMPVNQNHGPLIEEYLARTNRCIESALATHRRVILIRVDLRLPRDDEARPVGDPDRSYISKFFASLKSKIDSKGYRARAQGKRWHDTEIYYVWCKEYSFEHREHYHVAIFLNGDTFRGLGAFDVSQDSLYKLIVEAWASALGIPIPDAIGLPNFAGTGVTTIRRGEPYDGVFYWLSYFAKAKTKTWGDNKRSFGCSR